MRLYWMLILLFSSAALGQNYPSSIYLSQIAIEPAMDAHGFAIQTLHDARGVIVGATIPFMFCTSITTGCQSFQIADDGSFVGKNLTEHDALLLLVAELEENLARQIRSEQRNLKIRSDPPPASLKSGETVYRITDRDIWNVYVLADTNCEAQQIRTLNKNPGKRISVLHEMMHVATNCSNERGLHRLITQVSPKLLKLMRENPALVAYLMQQPDYEGK